MISSTAICNLALSRFGSSRISDLSETSETARLLSINYDNCLETVLRAFPWNFARRIEPLGLVTVVSTPGYGYLYTYPADCLNVFRVYQEGNARLQDKAQYKIVTDGSTKYIACDVEDAYCEYTANITDPQMYDSTFVKAFSYMLASEICNAKTGNSSKAKEMLEKYTIAVSEAKTNGSNENNVQDQWPTSYAKGRR